jgi:hypothetical protein
MAWAKASCLAVSLIVLPFCGALKESGALRCSNLFGGESWLWCGLPDVVSPRLNLIHPQALDLKQSQSPIDQLPTLA